MSFPLIYASKQGLKCQVHIKKIELPLYIRIHGIQKRVCVPIKILHMMRMTHDNSLQKE